MTGRYCDYCGGELLGEGVETDSGKQAHAICNAKGAADLDMNPSARQSLREMAMMGRLRPRMLRPYLPDGIDPGDLSDGQIRRLIR